MEYGIYRQHAREVERLLGFIWRQEIQQKYKSSAASLRPNLSGSRSALALFDWLKKRSQARVAGSDPANVRSRDSDSQARGRFRLEPLEPRVLLSGDSIVAVIASQSVLQTEAGNGDATAIIEQVDAGAGDGSSGFSERNSTAVGAPNPSVAWTGSWVVGAAEDANADEESALSASLEVVGAPTASVTQLAAAAAIAAMQSNHAP